MVCLNTMGQDREFTEDEKKFALRTVWEYRDRWESIEQVNLEKDIEQRIGQMDTDKEYKEGHENVDANEMERQIEEAFAPKEGEDPMDDDLKTMMQKRLRL